MRLRERVLEEAQRLVVEGRLESVGDVFLLTWEDFREAWPSAATLAERRVGRESLRRLAVPSTARRDEIEAALAEQPQAGRHSVCSDRKPCVARGV